LGDGGLLVAALEEQGQRCFSQPAVRTGFPAGHGPYSAAGRATASTTCSCAPHWAVRVCSPWTVVPTTRASTSSRPPARVTVGADVSRTLPGVHDAGACAGVEHAPGVHGRGLGRRTAPTHPAGGVEGDHPAVLLDGQLGLVATGED